MLSKHLTEGERVCVRCNLIMRDRLGGDRGTTEGMRGMSTDEAHTLKYVQQAGETKPSGHDPSLWTFHL